MLGSPEAELLVLEGLGVENSPFVRDPSLAQSRVSFEFSRMATVLQHGTAWPLAVAVSWSLYRRR